IMVPRWLRICLLVRLIMPWRLPAPAARIFPEAVILKRFLAEDFVFILGIWLSPFKAIRSRHGMPFTWPGGLMRGVKQKFEGDATRQAAPLNCLFRRDNHHDLAAFKARVGFNLGDLGGIGLHPVQKLV